MPTHEGTRRTTMVIGEVNYPVCAAQSYESTEGFYDTKEGGSEIWLVVGDRLRDSSFSVRSVCITGFYVGILECNASGTHAIERFLPDYFWKEGRGLRRQRPTIEGAICLAGSGMSPFDCRRREYWQPSFEDLTDKGRALYLAIKELYDQEPMLAFILDT